MPTGIITSYDLTVGVKINMDEAIYFLSPMDTPLLSSVDGSGNAVLSQMPVDQRKFYWMDEEALLPRSQLAAAATTGTTILTVQAGHQLRFSTGDVIVVQEAAHSETMRIVDISATTADVIHVTRAWAGTAGDIASGVHITSIGTALAEGSNPENARSIDRTEEYNFTQIYGPTKVSITRTEQGVGKYGISDEFGHQLMLRLKENAIAREQSFIYGVRSDSTTTKIRTSGGIKSFLTTNNDSTNTILNVANLSTNMAACWNAGGVPDQLWANPVSLATLNAANDSLVRVTNVETQRGVKPVMTVTTEFGDLTVVRNRNIRPLHAFGVFKEAICRRVFDPVFTERLAKVGDAENWMLVGEEGLEVKGEQHCFQMSALVY